MDLRNIIHEVADQRAAAALNRHSRVHIGLPAAFHTLGVLRSVCLGQDSSTTKERRAFLGLKQCLFFSLVQCFDELADSIRSNTVSDKETNVTQRDDHAGSISTVLIISLVPQCIDKEIDNDLNVDEIDDLTRLEMENLDTQPEANEHYCEVTATLRRKSPLCTLCSSVLTL